MATDEVTTAQRDRRTFLRRSVGRSAQRYWRRRRCRLIRCCRSPRDGGRCSPRLRRSTASTAVCCRATREALKLARQCASVGNRSRKSSARCWRPSRRRPAASPSRSRSFMTSWPTKISTGSTSVMCLSGCARWQVRMSGTPENPEGIAFLVWLAALAAGYDAGNKDKTTAVLDLYAKCRRVVDDERQPHYERGALQ